MQVAQGIQGYDPSRLGVGFTVVKLFLTSLVLTLLALLVALAGSAGVAVGFPGLGLY